MFVPEEAAILHADVDAFYASVEQRDDPSLRGRPVIVGGGVVLAASYEAMAYGIRTAMGGTRALRLCPHAVVVPPDRERYEEASAAVFGIFHRYTPLVEGLSSAEAFLDVTASRSLFGEGPEIAAAIRREVHEATGLTCSAGVPEMRRSPRTSRNASSIDSPSTSGVVLSKMSNTARLAST